MDELRSEVNLIAREFAEFRGNIAGVIKLLEGTPEHPQLLELVEALDKSHGEVAKSVGPAIDWLDQGAKELKEDLAKTESQLADLRQQLDAAQVRKSQPIPTPPPPKPPLVPGEGDPQYGLTLGDELLGLIGLGSSSAPSSPRLGEVWELESVDWKSVGGEAAAPPQAKPAADPAPTPPRPPARKDPKSIGGMESTDWDSNR